MEVSGQLYAPAALPAGETASDSQSWSGHHGEKNLLPIPEIKPWILGRPARSLVSMPTALSRLLIVYFNVLYPCICVEGQRKRWFRTVDLRIKNQTPSLPNEKQQHNSCSHASLRTNGEGWGALRLVSNWERLPRTEQTWINKRNN
jgi:hypothetical protein